MGALLDTCIIIDYLRSKSEAMEFVISQSETPLISAVTVMELYTGVRGLLEERQLELMIGNSRVVEISGETGALAGKFMKQYQPSHGLDTIDALIAATSKIHNIELITLNLKHFPMFEGLERPY